MKTYTELDAWVRGAVLEFGDPSIPVCQLFFRWQEKLEEYPQRDDALVAGTRPDGLVLLMLTPEGGLPIPLIHGAEQYDIDGNLVSYGSRMVTPGLWEITPSFNVPETVHAFAVLYGVPVCSDIPPWGRRVVLVGAL